MIHAAREAVTPFLAMEVLEAAQQMEREGADIVHLELGEPDFDTPEVVKRAAEQALAAGDTHYTHSLGTFALRDAICEHYLARYRVRLTPEQILVTAGTSPALMLLFAALLEPGDEVLLTNPCYACYPSCVRFAGGRPVFIDTYAEEAYQVDVARARALLSPRTRAILINSPANPTGAVLSAAALREVAELGPLVISDEIYHGLTYEGEERSILEFNDRAVVLNGFSKAYAMTGWRLGYVIGPPELIRRLQVLHQNFFISASAFVQAAGVAALREAGPDAARMRQEYAARRQIVLDGLAAMGLPQPVPPTGAFYVLIDVRRYSHDSLALAFDLLRQARVALTPGIDFGSNGEGHLRLSYATRRDRLREGLARLERFLAARH